jgi:DNA modification methylase
MPRTPSPVARRQPKRCNQLDGKRWLQNSISVWDDLKKTPEEQRLKHPAQFPVALVERLIESFLPAGVQTVLDPFCGSGSTLVAARRCGKAGVGVELSAEYVELAKQRLSVLDPVPTPPSAGERVRERGAFEAFGPLSPSEGEEGTRNGSPSAIINHAPVSRLLDLVTAESVDLCVTSPPYWNILNQKRTADYKSIRHYGNLDGDLGRIAEYDDYLQALTAVFQDVWHTLRPGAHCCIVVMDLRKRDRFFPLHSDLASRLQAIGYRWDDLVIWNRQAEYNNLRPLGYPAVFRINKVHEFILLMQKPKHHPEV